jgi:hypothetical protein
MSVMFRTALREAAQPSSDKGLGGLVPASGNHAPESEVAR